MISPLTIISLDQGKFYPEKLKTSLEEDLAVAGERTCLPTATRANVIKRLFAFLHSSKWRAQFTADIVNPSLRRSSISPSLPGRCSAPTAMKTAP